MNVPHNLMVIKYTEQYARTYSIAKVAMFNSSIISEEEVNDLLVRGLLDIQYNSKIVVMTEEQYKNLFDAVTRQPDNVKEFYKDLIMEQKEQM